MGCSSVKVPIIDWVRFILLEYLRLPEESHGCCVVLFCYLGSGLLAGLICCLVVVVPFHSVLDRRWLTLSTVLTSIASIRILSSQYAPARQWRTDAYRRVFAMLGYGFHRLNPAIFRIARWLSSALLVDLAGSLNASCQCWLGFFRVYGMQVVFEIGLGCFEWLIYCNQIVSEDHHVESALLRFKV